MKTIHISIRAANDGEVVNGSLTIQRKRGDGWTVDEVITVVSGMPGDTRTLLLGNDQRLVIEGESNTEVVYDRDQAAAVRRPVHRPPVVPTPMSTDGEETDTPREKTAEAAISGAGFEELQAQERRDLAISEARKKLFEAQRSGPTPPSNEPPLGPAPGNPLKPEVAPAEPTPTAEPAPGFPKPKVQLS